MGVVILVQMTSIEMQMCAVISIITKATENKRKNVEKKVDGFKMMTKTYNSFNNMLINEYWRPRIDAQPSPHEQ